MLAALEKKGIPSGVLSNKPHSMTVTCVERFFPSHRFATVLGASPDRPRKPDPAPALQSARAMRTPPADVLYVGDTPTDMKTGTGAGMTPVGVLWGFRSAPELKEAGAKHLVSAPAELLAFFEGPTSRGSG
jgi:phosphoglycolate phosphatase